MTTRATSALLIPEIRALPSKDISSVLCRAQRLRPRQRAELDRPELPAGLPPLPAYDVTSFLPGVMDALEGLEHRNFVAHVFLQEFIRSRESIDLNDIERSLVDVVEETIRRSRSGNELLIALRALQAVALRLGWHLVLPLRTLSICAVMALNISAADRTWPLAGVTDPSTQALGAAAFVTSLPVDGLCRLHIDDLTDDASLLAGRPVPTAVRPVLRAHLWLRHHLQHDPVQHLFPSRTGILA